MAVPVVGALCCAEHMRTASDRIGRWRTTRLTLDPTPQQIKIMETYCLLDRRAYERALCLPGLPRRKLRVFRPTATQSLAGQ